MIPKDMLRLITNLKELKFIKKCAKRYIYFFIYLMIFLIAFPIFMHTVIGLHWGWFGLYVFIPFCPIAFIGLEDWLRTRLANFQLGNELLEKELNR